MFYTPVTGFTALHKAAQRGDEEDVAALLAEVRQRQGGKLGGSAGAEKPAGGCLGYAGCWARPRAGGQSGLGR